MPNFYSYNLDCSLSPPVCPLRSAKVILLSHEVTLGILETQLSFWNPRMFFGG